VPFAGGYYKIDEPKAQQLLDKLIMKWENLNYYGKLVLQNKLALQFYHYRYWALPKSADGYEREWRFKFLQ
jgi:hypothetical protein